MSEDEWERRDWPASMLAVVLGRDAGFARPLPWPAAERARRVCLFECAVCRRIDRLLDGTLRDAVEAAEGYALGAQPAHVLENAAYRVLVLHTSGRLTGVRAYAAEAVLRVTHGDGGAMDFAMAASHGDPDRPERLDAACAGLLRCLFDTPFRPPVAALRPEWRTDTAVALARQMHAASDFAAMPVLADALQDAGCDDDRVLAHCRDERTRGDARTAGTTQAFHARGCWVLDLVLGRE